MQLNNYVYIINEYLELGGVSREYAKEQANSRAAWPLYGSIMAWPAKDPTGRSRPVRCLYSDGWDAAIGPCDSNLAVRPRCRSGADPAPAQ